MLMSINLARTIVGAIGNVISLGLFLSPANTIIRIFKSKDVEGFHPYIYNAGLFNCALWVFYGFVKPNSTLVWTINALGILLYSIYLVVFGIFAPNRKRAVVGGLIVAELAAIAAVVVPILMLVHDTGTKTTIIGIICIIFNILLYASPLTVVANVFRTKNIEYLPFWVCVANLANGSIWTTYSFIGFDINIFVCNSVGTLLAIFQMGLQWWFGGFPCQKKHKTGDAGEVQLQDRLPV